jgi:hypothetical protein
VDNPSYRIPIHRNKIHDNATFRQLSSSFLLWKKTNTNQYDQQQRHRSNLFMVKNRVGLEQKRESATPTGAVVEAYKILQQRENAFVDPLFS